MTVPAPGAPSPGAPSSGAPSSGGPVSGAATPEVIPPGTVVLSGSAPGGPVPGGFGPVPGPGHEVPAPPAGPGVVPPFPAPPVEGRTFRMWLGLGVAALAVVLCCGGGAVALVGLMVASTEATNEQARAVVGDYFAAVRDRQYARAYQLLCDDARHRESPAEFEDRISAEPDITTYRVGDLALTDEITVPVEVTYDGGQRDNLQASLAQDTSTGEFEVCDVG